MAPVKNGAATVSDNLVAQQDLDSDHNAQQSENTHVYARVGKSFV
jgi:hypothetical protein